MPPCIDCYTLVDRRDKQTARDFLPHRRSLYHEHSLPRDAKEAEVVLTTDEEAMEYLAEHPEELYTIYVVNEAGPEPRFAMVGYTQDGMMTLGLSCEAEHPALAEEYLGRLKTFSKTDHGFCGVEMAPPGSSIAYEESVEAFGRTGLLDNPSIF